MVEDKRKMEQRYSQLEDELEDEQSNLEILVEKARKNGAMVIIYSTCYMNIIT